MRAHELSIDVSRETLEKLEHYLELLKKWNPAINLVAKSTLEHAWTRHFVDSTQVYQRAPQDWHHWADFGSGGGFPGAVVAILASELQQSAKVTLVESDQRKAAFLRNVLRETESKGDVVAKRIENIDPLNADVISARALASLTKLLEFANLHGQSTTSLLFPKGINWQKEVSEAQELWSFDLSAITSSTDPNAIVLKIKGLARV